MDNFQDDILATFTGKLIGTLLTKVVIPMQLIACSDIGAFSLLALQDPERYKGRTISLAGDALTGQQILSQYREVIGKPMPRTFTVLAALSAFVVKELKLMFSVNWRHLLRL